MDRDELILEKLSEVATDLKQIHKDVTDVKLQQVEDRRRSETADVKLAGDVERMESKLTADLQQVKSELTADLQQVESKLTADLQQVESKIDGVVDNIRERKIDTNERWKIGGIIVSSILAILALIKSFFFS